MSISRENRPGDQRRSSQTTSETARSSGAAGRWVGTLVLAGAATLASVVAVSLVRLWPEAESPNAPRTATNRAPNEPRPDDAPAEPRATAVAPTFEGDFELPEAELPEAEPPAAGDDEPSPALPQTTAEIARRLLAVPGARHRGFALLIGSDPDSALDVLRLAHDAGVGNERSERSIAAAIRMLGGTEGERVVDELYRYLESEAPAVQRASARMLEDRGDARPMADWIASYEPALASPDASMRARAVAELGRTESAQAVAPIAIALEDSDRRVRLSAALALSRTGGPLELDLLAPLLADSSPTVRRVGERAVQRLQARVAVMSPDLATRDTPVTP